MKWSKKPLLDEPHIKSQRPLRDRHSGNERDKEVAIDDKPLLKPTLRDAILGNETDKEAAIGQTIHRYKANIHFALPFLANEMRQRSAIGQTHNRKANAHCIAIRDNKRDKEAAIGRTIHRISQRPPLHRHTSKANIHFDRRSRNEMEKKCCYWITIYNRKSQRPLRIAILGNESVKEVCYYEPHTESQRPLRDAFLAMKGTKKRLLTNQIVKANTSSHRYLGNEWDKQALLDEPYLKANTTSDAILAMKGQRSRLLDKPYTLKPTPTA
ncbi:hypothetical protein K7X08_002685 [Anisodus acutangulus]|uniref:Uncharacterized protein n=1 Tax=Anisodus acutangulus TaxID=402998 RepID=A0A9Q1L1G3_9SOLA|nr:hypothetical protein K7X08_002685 [Anisodus acutangulus]